MSNYLISAFFFLSSALLVAGCSRQGDAAVEISTATQSGSMVQSKKPKIGGEKTPVLQSKASQQSSWQDYIATLNDGDRYYLMSLSTNYYGALEYEGAKEANNLARLGFPTPEEWMAARSLTSEELRVRARNGDRLSKIFYSEYIAGRIQAMQKNTGKRSLEEISELYTEEQFGDLKNEAIQADVIASGLLAEYPTAFNAYLAGRVKAYVYGYEASLLASIALAGDLGDHRADDILLQYSSYSKYTGNKTEADPILVLDIYRNMRKSVGLK